MTIFFFRTMTMQTMISANAPRASKKLMTVARAGMIVVFTCTRSVVILSWLVADGDHMIKSNSLFLHSGNYY